MSILNSRLVKTLVPKFIRKRILAKVIRTNVLNYYDGLNEPISKEISDVVAYIRSKGITVFPYDSLDQYVPEDVEVFDDPGKGMRYVLLDGKRLYYKKSWSKGRIRKTFNGLRKEQDPRCPDCYENELFHVEEGDVVLDIGAAEGNFALSVVEKASRIILFESSDEWLEALRATFEPWKEKVTIVNKFVSDVADEENTSLDDYIKQGEKISFLKIDVEGAESSVLRGCERVLKEQTPLKVAICTYHKQGDEQEFLSFFRDRGFEASSTDGFMLVYHDKRLKAPFFRRGLVRAIKK